MFIYLIDCVCQLVIALRKVLINEELKSKVEKYKQKRRQNMCSDSCVDDFFIQQ